MKTYTAIITLTCVCPSLLAQVQYVPIRIPTHPAVSPAWFGESFGVDGDELYIGGLGSSPGLPNEPGGVYRFDKDTLTYQ